MKSAMAIQCLPQVEGGKEAVYHVIDQAIKVIKESGLPYTVCPFETVIEGPLESLLPIAQKAHQAALEAGSSQVATYIKLFSAPNLGSTKEKLSRHTPADFQKDL